VVRGAGQVVEFEYDCFTARNGDVTVGSETADAVVAWVRRHRVIHVDETIENTKKRIESDSQQTAFAARVDVQCQKRRRQKRAVLDHAQPSALFADEDASVGRDLHRRRTRDTGDCRFCETSGQRRRLN